MRITKGQLRKIISEEIRRVNGSTLEGTEDEMKAFVSEMVPDEVTMDDLVDEETGEIYLSSGEPASKSKWARQEQMSKEKTSRFVGDDEPSSDPRESLQSKIATFVDGYDVEDLASHGDVEDLVSDASDAFFWSNESSGWEDLAADAGMTQGEVKAWVADELYSKSLSGL